MKMCKREKINKYIRQIKKRNVKDGWKDQRKKYLFIKKQRDKTRNKKIKKVIKERK
jgi:hypothetical protein